MSHKHPVYDNDGYFVLDPKTKTLKNESEKESIVQFDHNSEEIRFKLPKIIEGHDMSKVDLIQVHFANTSTGTSAILRSTNKAPINITGTLKDCEDDPEYLTCSWLIGEESTQLSGSLKFKLKFICYGDDETLAYKMNTLYYDKYQVLESEDSSEGVIEIYPDAIVNIEERLSAIEEILKEGDFGPSGSPARIGEVTLTSAGWVGAASPYSQIVEIDGVTPYSQVDLTPSIEQLSIFYHKDLAFVTENRNGVVTVYALGDKPQNDYTIQVTITEVSV